MKRLFKNEIGITLIALVITIIVLLILAGVSIATLTGENGILTRTTTSRENTEIAKEKEQVEMAAMGARMNSNKGEYLTILEADFEKELDSYIGKRNVDYTLEYDEENEMYKVTYIESNRAYIITNTGKVSKDELPLIKDLKGELAVNKKTEAQDENGDKVVIPEGFIVSNDSGDTVQDGVVIEDSSANQYVWIPVYSSDEREWGVKWPSEQTAKIDAGEDLETEDITAIKEALKEYTSTYGDKTDDIWFGDASTINGMYAYGYGSSSYFNYYKNGNLTKTEYNNLYKDVIVSLYKNGGFYIGRYEMGMEVVTDLDSANTSKNIRTKVEYVASEKTKGSTNNSNEAPNTNGMNTPISKANAIPYYRITQSQAEMLAKKVTYNDIISSIMFGVQWDCVCVFMQYYGKMNDGTKFNGDSRYLTDSSYCKLWGIYRGTTRSFNERAFFYDNSGTTPVWASIDSYTAGKICTTGASEECCVLNIYDFGGNVNEWTLEKQIETINYICTVRGGNSDHYDIVADKQYSSQVQKSIYDGSRIALCLK